MEKHTTFKMNELGLHVLGTTLGNVKKKQIAKVNHYTNKTTLLWIDTYIVRALKYGLTEHIPNLDYW